MNHLFALAAFDCLAASDMAKPCLAAHLMYSRQVTFILLQHAVPNFLPLPSLQQAGFAAAGELPA